MWATLLLLALTSAVVTAIPAPEGRIVGGTVTTIGQWPMGVSMLLSRSGLSFQQACGGSVLNNQNVLSAAHCFAGNSPSNWRMRVGSTNANSGGVVHNTARILNHPNYNARTTDFDIAILRTSTRITFNTNVRAGAIAGTNYNLPDGSVVWAIGWGTTSSGGRPSEQLRQVQIWTVNQATCRQRYAARGRTITDNMLCSGWLDVGGRDQCQGDSGGPLLHNNVIVGVCSWGNGCAQPRYPGVNARVSRFTNWIRANS
ncbi:jg21942 [Pararge aegeria aegeria]|uniref:Jg21942 protein n=1 Tax=Pararge aegeria aegeria TaxID=348720 RepID=A0A8S4SFY7_9NEOP|nr:jg21942 [Pararge aegeria aegeria]